MKTKGDNPSKLIGGKGLSAILSLYFKINQLKQLYRQGWLKYISPERCESVADHTFGVAVLAVLVNDFYSLGLDVERILIMSLLHELGETKIGDLTPQDGVPLLEKHRLERAVVVELFKDFPDGEKYIKIWDEFEERKTAEANFVFQIEKLEMALQAKIYEGLYGGDLFEFQEYVEKILTDGLLRSLIKELENL